MLIGGAVVFRKMPDGRVVWLLVEEESGKWEMPKAIVRKGESSVRAVLRVMGEQGGIICRVLEEAGRLEDRVEINGRKASRKMIYYLVLARNSGEILGFSKSSWLSFSQALKRLSWEKERMILKQAKLEFDKWLSRQRK